MLGGAAVTRGAGFWLGALLVATVVAGVGLRALGDWDLWWHLLTGRLALDQGSLLPEDVLSLTRFGEPWLYKDLGGEILLWGVYAAGGIAGLAVLQLVLAVALAALIALRIARRAPATWLVLGVTGGAFVVAAFRVVMRPDLFTLVLLAALLVLVEHRSERGRRVVGIAGLHLLWANLHRGVVLGLCLLWARAIHAAVLHRVPFSGTHPVQFSGTRAATMTALAATAAALLNPFGLTTLLRALRVASGEALSAAVSEWESLPPGELLAEFPHAAVWMGLVLVTVPLAAWRRRREDPRGAAWDLLLALAFLALGLRAARMLPLMAIATAGPLATAVQTLLAGRAGRLATSRALPALAGLVVALGAWTEPHIVWSRPGLMRDWYPEASVELIAEAPVVGQGYTTFTYAGYLLFHLWPDKRVICDGRYDTVYDDATMLRCFGAERDPGVFTGLRDEYDLQWVLAHNRPGPARDPARPRALDFLDVDPAWALVHWDTASLLYVRRGGPNDQLTRRAYRYLRPHDIDVSLFRALEATRGDAVGRAALDAEIWRLQAAAPADYRVNILLALYLHAIGATEHPAFRTAVDALQLDRARDPASINRVLEWVGADSP